MWKIVTFRVKLSWSFFSRIFFLPIHFVYCPLQKGQVRKKNKIQVKSLHSFSTLFFNQNANSLNGKKESKNFFFLHNLHCMWFERNLSMSNFFWFITFSAFWLFTLTLQTFSIFFAFLSKISRPILSFCFEFCCWSTHKLQFFILFFVFFQRTCLEARNLCSLLCFHPVKREKLYAFAETTFKATNFNSSKLLLYSRAFTLPGFSEKPSRCFRVSNVNETHCWFLFFLLQPVQFNTKSWTHTTKDSSSSL